MSFIKSTEFKLQDDYITAMTPRKAFLESQSPLKMTISRSQNQILNKTAKKEASLSEFSSPEKKIK